ncbi:MAG: PD-(D/E)XK nuclease family protein [Gammaproteobacteria bacterium]|nr:PD-(D/E)XK nuclease family protein [Gammaproteobacteria bacterium]
MDLFDQLEQQSTLLTPNRRLSASLLKKHHLWQSELGKKCWPSLDILPITSWLQRLWKALAASQIDEAFLPLTSSQEQLLWEEILRDSAESDNLLQVSSTAQLARSAWTTLKQWQVSIDDPELRTTEDSMIFQRWAERFQALCEEKHWLDTSSLTDVVIERIQTGEIEAPQHILLYGFTEFSPQYQTLLSACKDQGSHITYYEPMETNNTIHRMSLTDEETEIRTMARWAKKRWEDNPNHVIGCVFPRLEQMRESVIQIFSAVFSEENTLSLDHTTLPFNISAGKSLASYPVIHTALQLLNLHTNKMPIEKLSGILRSPFLGEAEKEMTKRAQLENALRNNNTSTISLTKLIEHAATCPALVKRFNAYLDARNEIHGQVLPISKWVTIFIDLLNHLGWPGERSLNSAEYQVVKSWFDLLKEYAGFDTVLAPIHFKRALDYLTRLTIQKIFQPESPEANIQLLGMLEAAELPFDHLWVMGLDDTAWPPFPKPNPFIPQRLQKTLNMPHATADRELIYCKELTTQLKRGAANVLFSHALKNDDAELRPSPLITDITEISVDQLHLSAFNTPDYCIYESRDMEYLHDEIAPSVTAPDQIRGGTKIFKLQAACPFKAFAEIRLHAKQVDAPTLGLRATDRGSILHKALEMIWRELQSQAALLSLAQNELKELIQRCVDQAIFLIAGESIESLRYLALESMRLQSIMLDWLNQEKIRADFKVVALEQEVKTTFCQIPVTLRIDRIDELNNGKKLIIDYKSGKNNPVKGWFGDRPDEPQLPLYCVIDPSETIGIAFAQINPENMGFYGISQLSIGIDSVKNLAEMDHYTDAVNWNDQVLAWQKTLENLGDRFYQGDARVDPKDPVETCQYCKLQALCRVNETNPVPL